MFTGVECNTTGAGDHLDKVDARIRRFKEMARLHAGKMPDSFIDGLVKYVASRINAKRLAKKPTTVAPRVAFTGRKIMFHKEFSIGFGDYVECYAEQRSGQK
jgi:hypothetical protein